MSKDLKSLLLFENNIHAKKFHLRGFVQAYSGTALRVFIDGIIYIFVLVW